MAVAVSQDGTKITFDRTGTGAPLILVLGAFNERGAGEALAAYLATHFSVINYDRRGRGASEDTPPYSVERELDDLRALIDSAGGSASVFGYSSGAVLAMLAVERGLPVIRLALYEPPFPMAGKGPQFWHGLAGSIEEAIARGNNGEAVELFQTQGVGIPPEVVAQLRHAPFWPALERMAPTLAYESQILASDPQLPGRVSVPTLVIAGGDSPEPLRNAAQAVSTALPNGTLEVLLGQTHDLVPEAVGPVLTTFLAGE